MSKTSPSLSSRLGIALILISSISVLEACSRPKFRAVRGFGDPRMRGMGQGQPLPPPNGGPLIANPSGPNSELGSDQGSGKESGHELGHDSTQELGTKAGNETVEGAEDDGDSIVEIQKQDEDSTDGSDSSDRDAGLDGSAADSEGKKTSSEIKDTIIESDKEDKTPVNGPVAATSMESDICSKAQTTYLQTIDTNARDLGRLFFNAALMQGKPRFVFSPFSVSAALHLLGGGTSGPVMDDLIQKKMVSCFNSTLKTNSGSAGKATSNQVQMLALTSALEGVKNATQSSNSIWMSKESGNAFLKDYSELVKTNLGAESKEFVSVKEINQWVTSNTQGKINEIFAEGTPITFALVNAISFADQWEVSLSEAKQRISFKESNGSPKEVPTIEAKLMVQSIGFHEILNVRLDPSYSSQCELKFKMVRLPFKTPSLAMDFILPPPCAFKDPKLSSRLFDAMMEARKAFEKSPVQKAEILVKMPKFKMESDFDLLKYFKAMRFDLTRLEFSPMVQSPQGLFVDAFLHKAMIQVDEMGAQAAAVTAVGGTKGLPLPTPEAIFNSPFFYVLHLEQNNTSTVKKESTNVPLFIGFYGQAIP